jgi:hypothetical protein
VSSPAAAARHGGQGRRREDGVGEEEDMTAFYKHGLGCDGGVTTVILLCYGGASAGVRVQRSAEWTSGPPGARRAAYGADDEERRATRDKNEAPRGATSA